MALREYARKRRFDVTAEPPPKTPRRRRTRGLRFVVQKHRASHLHYDFRLEWDGVLLSWAVPKGPSLDPAVKRLAMAVEDHPLAYARFEGIIPADEYGGGTVMVWDRGTYEPETPDVGRARAAGEIKFELHGEKLQGGFVLVRTRGRESRSWLLLKRRDAAATDDDLTTSAPRSVLSQRLMAEIAFDEGGDVETAAGADPPAAIRALMRDPRTRVRTPRRRAKVWRSNRRAKRLTPVVEDAAGGARTLRTRPSGSQCPCGRSGPVRKAFEPRARWEYSSSISPCENLNPPKKPWSRFATACPFASICMAKRQSSVGPASTLGKRVDGRLTCEIYHFLVANDCIACDLYCPNLELF